MAEPDRIDQRTFGRVQADGQSVSNSDRLPAEPESAFGEDMNVYRRLQRRNTSAPRDRDVNAIGNDVSQPMARKGGNETERTLRDTVGHLEKIMIDRRSIGPPIEAAAHLFKMPLVAVPVDALRREPGGDRIRVSEEGAETAWELSRGFGAHR